MEDLLRTTVGMAAKLGQFDSESSKLYKAAANAYADIYGRDTAMSTSCIMASCGKYESSDDVAELVEIAARDRMCALIVFVFPHDAQTYDISLQEVVARTDGDPILSEWIHADLRIPGVLAFMKH